MIKKISILFVILVLMIASSTPAVAEKPPEPGGNRNTTNPGNGNAAHENQGNGQNGNHGNSNNSGGNRNAANPNAQPGNQVSRADSVSGHGFDDAGYNRTAKIFNGTAWDWCMDKVGDETWCTEYLGEYANDKLIMKWNAEWDRGNAEGWSKPPYDAWENNQWNGNVPGGSGSVWHYKIVWVGPCDEGEYFENGGYCIWGQFEVIMDHGTADGVHEWLAHAIPSGYVSYP